MKATRFYFRDGKRLGWSTYGFLFRQRRKQLGLTLPAVAKAAGISKGGLSKIEHGADFQISTLNRICTALRFYPTLGQRTIRRQRAGRRRKRIRS